jgi:epoxide hydrolase-like predicted phosphatase
VIKALIFDCFGVLTTDTWRAFLDTLPPSVDKQAARDLNHAYDAGMITQDEFLKQVHEVTGQYPRRLEDLSDGEIVKNLPLLNFIRQQKKRYKIGMISNISSNWIRESFLNSEEQSLFDDMIFSYEVGMTKPDSRIFELACQRLDVKPSEVVFTDDIDFYVESAKKIGMQGIVYHDFEQFLGEIKQLLS